jgi:hypothetical protein
MTHEQIVAALQCGYQLDDARESRRGCYPIRKPVPRTTRRRMGDGPPPEGEPDPTGFGDGCLI